MGQTGGGSGDPAAPLLDDLVRSASFDKAARTLEVTTGGGTLAYRKVLALGVTQGARMAAPDWVQDTLPQTIFGERVAGVARAEAALGVTWLLGDAADFERCAVRDALGFTGGRWFRIFVGAKEVGVAPPEREAPPAPPLPPPPVT
jgi:hypothetical protein